jgi:F0F1-type ATP synthase assembly protein I
VITPARVAGVVLALLMLGTGGLVAGAGVGWFSDSTSTTWAVVGAVMAGLGVALVISIVQHARQQAQVGELERSRYGGRR